MDPMGNKEKWLVDTGGEEKDLCFLFCSEHTGVQGNEEPDKLDELALVK
jgi:hypothetical protein